MAVYSRAGFLRLLVETRNRPQTSRQWAAEYLRNLIDHHYHGEAPGAPYFLLVLPDSFYLWRTDLDLGGAPDPHYGGSAGPALESYLEDFELTLEETSEDGFKLLVSALLWDLADPDLQEKDVHEGLRKLLFPSGLRGAIEGGSVKLDPSI